jgi:hypothetical protein
LKRIGLTPKKDCHIKEVEMTILFFKLSFLEKKYCSKSLS